MKEELSDFLKIAYKFNRVKNLEDAFKEYPVNDEWHQGKVGSIVREDKARYDSSYKIGDIVFVSEYTYDNGKIGNNHLFVIIDKDNTVVPIENFGMLISSNLDKLKYNTNILLEKDTLNNLHKDSIVKTDVIYKIVNEQILFKIGRVDSDKIKKYKESFYNSLNNN